MRTTDWFNWLVMITFSAGIMIFILTQVFYVTCESILDGCLLTWRVELDVGLNNNWKRRWHVDFEDIKCYGEQMLIDLKICVNLVDYNLLVV